MNYQVVFDIATAGYKSWTYAAPGLAAVAIGAALFAARKSFPGWLGRNPRVPGAFAFVFLGVSIIWTLVSFSATYLDYRYLLSSAQTGGASVVEGIVTDFKPAPADSQGMEKFCLQKVCFEYADEVITGGFNQTQAHGGPIRASLPVRVSYVGKAIVKLEIGR